MKSIAYATILAVFITSAFAGAAGTPSEKRFNACRDRLKKAQKLDLLYDMKMEKGIGWRVLVGPTYFNIPIDAKEGFAETLNCFMSAGDTGFCNSFELRDWRTGRAVGRYENCRLKVD